MKVRRGYLILIASVLAVGAVGILFFGTGSSGWIVEGSVPADRSVAIRPDYAGVVMPPNIAPLNFIVEEPGSRYCVKISDAGGQEIVVSGKSPKIMIPIDDWKALLEANRGGELYVDVYVESGGQWQKFDRIVNRIAAENIDSHLAYRLLRPAYNSYRDDGLSISQRNLENFDESVVIRNDSFDGGCMNCHTFHKNSPETFLFHVRSPDVGKPSVLYRNGQASRLYTETDATPAAGYTSWHPSGKAIAFSVNKVRQFLHTIGENRDVFDFASDVLIYNFETNQVTTNEQISSPEMLETYPTWSPDGKQLYFCRAPQLPIEQYKDVKYDLMRIDYDLETDTWGELETVLSASETNLSVTHPLVTPDGKFLVFCMCERGNFSIFQPSTDLYVMDLSTGDYRRLDINSDQTDSWHGFSSNGRWMVFSSKRLDGLFARPYFTYVDSEGKFHKPILLPQRDPAYYDSYTKTYNRPELITGPIAPSQRQLAKAIWTGQTTRATFDPNAKLAKTPTSAPAAPSRQSVHGD